jgi:uncharacterized surface protein with fasciclin (FAS1) repeats
VLTLLPFAAVAQDSLSEKADIVDTAIAAGNFTTLVELVQAAGLVETLQGEGPFTVFAPTDDAFAAVPADILETLAADPALLERVLLYHVVPSRLIAALISDGKEVATAEGSNVMFGFVDGVKSVNGAEIIARDIQASNGVIHVIDSVILPPDVAALLPSADVSPAAEEEAAATETPAAEEEAAATETPAAEEEAAATETPAAEEEAAATETPAAEEEAAATETPAAEEEAAATETPAAEEEAAATETPAAEEEAAATETPAAEEEAAATETPAAEEEAAPETLPVTGSTYGASPWIVLALVVAAALTLMVRRRMI